MIWDVLTGFDPVMLGGFVLAGILLAMTPGSDFVFVTASAIRGGSRVGMAAAIGVSLGILVHVTMAAAGLSALLAAFPVALDVIRWLGAAYLLWLAVQAWRNAGQILEGRGAGQFSRAVWRGFVTNVLNPKTALFIFAFIPQFADPTIGPVGVQVGILGVLFMIEGTVFMLCLGAMAGVFAHALAARARLLSRISAVMFGGLAARLVWN